MFVDTIGEGDDVVLLHGLPQHPDHNRELCMGLSANFRVHLIHLPGYGRSLALPDARPQTTTQILARALTDRGVTRPALVGVSGGFYRALDLAGAFHSIWALVGIGAIDRFTLADRQGFLNAAEAWEAGVDLGPTLVERFLSPAYAEAHPQARAIAAACAKAASRDHLARELRAMADAPDLDCVADTLSCPVLLRTGERDLATPPAIARAFADRMKRRQTPPPIQVEIVPGAGHLLPIEDLEQTLASVTRFLVASRPKPG